MEKANFDFRVAARSIREHKRIHKQKEPQAILISKYLDYAADLFDEIDKGEVKIVNNNPKYKMKFIAAQTISEATRITNSYLAKGWEYVDTKIADAYGNTIMVILRKEIE